MRTPAAFSLEGCTVTVWPGACTLEACTAPTLVGTSGYAAAVCIQNSDFAYNSPLWDTTKDDALTMFESDPVGGNSANDGTGLDVGTPVAPGGARCWACWASWPCRLCAGAASPELFLGLVAEGAER